METAKELEQLEPKMVNGTDAYARHIRQHGLSQPDQGCPGGYS